jgi:hypothetical protein
MTQNVPANAFYARAMETMPDSLLAVRGVRRTGDDRLRGEVIERLMCDLQVDPVAIGPAMGLRPPGMTAHGRPCGRPSGTGWWCWTAPWFA